MTVSNGNGIVDNPTREQQPEALASFAETARNGGQRPTSLDDPNNPAGRPLATDPDAKADAAERVLREGVTGEDAGADEAIDQLPDRTEGSEKIQD